MKVELHPFQKKALESLRLYVNEANGTYQRLHVPQVISFTAPTGSGKTIIMSSLIEEVLFGNEKFPEIPDSIFIWLSDSPELNLQSKEKIDLKSDKIRLDQCVIVDDESFDYEYFEDGHIYFLNTQKLGKSSNLTKHSDFRQYTIWETLSNTARDKADRLFFIIDEAHRGMQGKKAGEATTIMQKFLKGSPENNLLPMPVVIGMTATPERFDNLIKGTSSTRYPVVVTADEVRSSGLLKDRIIITHPNTHSINTDMAVLQAAADEWKTKCEHWEQYCYKQHYAYFNPVFVIQVLNTKGGNVSETDLNDCLMKIEERTGFIFQNGEVVHTFGDSASLLINGLTVPYEEPSRIADNKKIRIVFFKESLSTGWDCPRAETMMSFRHAADATYIAQLLGRMIRTPMQMRIQRDESLNDVHLFLPYFDAITVKKIVNELQNSEDGELPTDIIGSELGSDDIETYTVLPKHPKAKQFEQGSGQQNLLTSYPTDNNAGVESKVDASSISLPNNEGRQTTQGQATSVFEAENQTDKPTPQTTGNNNNSTIKITPVEQLNSPTEIFSNEINREEILLYINDSGLSTNEVGKTRVNDYQKSLYKLTRLLSQSGIYVDATKDVIDQIVEIIHKYITLLKETGKYEELVGKVKEFKLAEQWFDVFGESIDKYVQHDIYSTTDTDIDRQFRIAESKLGNEGIGNKYGDKYFDADNPNGYKIDIIIFVADSNCQKELTVFAENEYHRLNDKYRRQTVNLDEKYLSQYNRIVSDGDLVSEHNYRLPESISVQHVSGSKEYPYHLFTNENGTASFTLNSWEEGVLNEEMNKPDFICWLRNPSRKSWSLCVHYKVNEIDTSMYPDFIIIRKDQNTKYVIDVLEPHRGDLKDNFGKAKGLAEYARKNQKIVGRVQLIRQMKNNIGKDGFKRLDMCNSITREKVLKMTNADELDHIFETDGFFD